MSQCDAKHQLGRESVWCKTPTRPWVSVSDAKHQLGTAIGMPANCLTIGTCLTISTCLTRTPAWFLGSPNVHHLSILNTWMRMFSGASWVVLVCCRLLPSQIHLQVQGLRTTSGHTLQDCCLCMPCPIQTDPPERYYQRGYSAGCERVKEEKHIKIKINFYGSSIW